MSKTFNDTGMGRIIAWISARVFKKSEAVTTQVLGIDSSPSNNSSNLVTSGGVYDALSTKYEKPSGGIPASDLADGVIPTVHNIPSGGTSGQVLTKSSSTDYAVEWSTPDEGFEYFDVTYNVTTPQEIKAAVDAGKFVRLVLTGSPNTYLPLSAYKYATNSKAPSPDAIMGHFDHITQNSYTEYWFDSSATTVWNSVFYSTEVTGNPTIPSGTTPTTLENLKIGSNNYYSIPSVPVISTDISSDASSDVKTTSPKAVKTYVDTALTSALKYKGVIGSNQTQTTLPATHKVGDVWVVADAGTFAGKACEVGDYVICKTDGTSTNDAHWDVVNGENQVENKSASLAAAGSSATIATVDGTNITVTTPSEWTGLNKTGTITGITMNGASKGTSGVVDLGTVITSETSLSKGATNGSGNAVTDISVSGHQITLTKNKTFLESETDPVFSASAAAGITSSDITNWNSKTDNVGTVTQVNVGTTAYNPTSGVVSLPAYPSAPGTLNTTATTAQSTNSSEALSGSVTLHKVAKTGTYSDLIGTPTVPVIESLTTAEIDTIWNNAT